MMKRILTVLMTGLGLLAAPGLMEAGETVLPLEGEWQFRQAGTSGWHDAEVPGCVHLDLMSGGMIPDPFYSREEKDLQWIGEKDWEYARSFTVDEGLLDNSHVILCMEGLDTYADVYVNDWLVCSCDNMFRTWNVDVKPYLRPGDNEIRIYFSSVFKVDMPKYLASPFKLRAWPNNDQNNDIWLSLYARKAGYHYGWDWGPRLITAGIWRGISLRAWSGADLESVHIKTLSVPEKSGGYAEMSADCRICSDAAGEASINISYGTGKVTRTVAIEKGCNDITVPFRIKNPELWCCNGAGEQHLYDFDVTMDMDGKRDTMTVTTGIRKVEVIREKDEAGQSMYVRLNGRPVYMKGANYIPMDNFPTRTPDEKYEHIIGSAAKTGMNMLRIWGGGIYENDIFYELCDRYGILVWQDMMFACGMFPADEAYLENVRHEVRDNVRRLRNHPCIALWNGNNENEISYFGWGWSEHMSPEEDSVYRSNLRKLFYETIPDAIAEEDDTRYYHPTSPVTGYNGIRYNYGDVHYWSVWKGGWVEEYTEARNIGRFMSEYGFQSYPDMRTLREVIPADELYLGSYAVLSHQRAKNDETRDPYFGDKMMTMYMSRYFTVPEDFDDFIYMSQVMQAEAVKVGVEAHRRAKPYCMGTLFWQINDCWPVASWSSIDYYGRWKALQYYVPRMFSEILVSPYEAGDNVAFKVISDRDGKFEGSLTVRTLTLTGEELSRREMPVRLGPDEAADVFSAAKSDLLCGREENTVFVTAALYEDGSKVSENIYYPVYSNRYDYPEPDMRCDVEEADGGLWLTLSSDVLVRNLWLDTDDPETVFTDNSLTLIPGEPVRIFVRSGLDAAQFRDRLKTVSLNDLQYEN